jgi:multicomponent K+:H+ antiporter subunit A
MFVVLLLPIVGGLFAMLARRFSATIVAWSASLPVLLATALFATRAQDALGGIVQRERWDWVPAAGIDLALRADGLSWVFGMMVLVIGLLVQLYARYYMQQASELGRLYGLLGLFMSSMLGLVLANNLLVLVMFWEATSLVSFLLIGFKRTDETAQLGARTALTVTATGGLCLLGGVLLLGRIAGSLDLDVVLASGDAIRAHAWYMPALLLVLAGAFTKSAQFPFHFWLPRAMAAPTPISAYLHSATMVKAGLFLLARFYPVLAGTDAWFGIVGTTGMLTLLFGAYAAMWQHDLKGLLAYSTISHLGLITLLLGFGTPMAVGAAVFHLLNHATFKASLFMAAGIIDHEVGTRDMRVLNGLWKHMPWTGALAIVAAGAMAGVPLLNGFISKEMFFAESLAAQDQGLRWVEPAAAVIAGALAVGYSLRFIMEVFFNDEGRAHPKTPHEAPLFMRLPAALLALACLAVGVAPALFVTGPLSAAVGATLQAPPPTFDLALWHGVNAPLIMTLIALGGGVLLYRWREAVYRWHDQLPPLEAASVFDAVLRASHRGAGAATRMMENGSLQRYVMLVVVTGVTVGTLPLLADGARAPLQLTWALDAPSLVVWGLLLIATVATVRYRHRPIAAVVAISVVGLLVSLAFVRLAAPDLALTQLLVELVTILLLLLTLPLLSADTRDGALSVRPDAPVPTYGLAPISRRRRDAVLAVAAGIATAFVALMVLERPVNTRADYYIAESLPKGGGHNVVNVILVDFRGFDTLGEVAVLASAALGAMLVLSGLRLGPDALKAPAAAQARLDRYAERHPLMLMMVSRALLPLALLMAAFILLRGHDLPGGGFAAGLLMAIALAAQSMASGQQWTRARLRTDFVRWIVAGLGLATLTGLAAWAKGQPFLTSTYRYIEVPVLGKVPFSSALFFDIGVLLVVVAVVMLILDRLARLTTEHFDAETPAASHVPAPDPAEFLT